MRIDSRDMKLSLRWKDKGNIWRTTRIPLLSSVTDETWKLCRKNKFPDSIPEGQSNREKLIELISHLQSIDKVFITSEYISTLISTKLDKESEGVSLSAEIHSAIRVYKQNIGVSYNSQKTAADYTRSANRFCSWLDLNRGVYRFRLDEFQPTTFKEARSSEMLLKNIIKSYLLCYTAETKGRTISVNGQDYTFKGVDRILQTASIEKEFKGLKKIWTVLRNRHNDLVDITLQFKDLELGKKSIDHNEPIIDLNKWDEFLEWSQKCLLDQDYFYSELDKHPILSPHKRWFDVALRIVTTLIHTGVRKSFSFRISSDMISMNGKGSYSFSVQDDKTKHGRVQRGTFPKELNDWIRDSLETGWMPEDRPTLIYSEGRDSKQSYAGKNKISAMRIIPTEETEVYFGRRIDGSSRIQLSDTQLFKALLVVALGKEYLHSNVQVWTAYGRVASSNARLIDTITYHIIRRNMACKKLREGETIEQVKYFLGHSSSSGETYKYAQIAKVYNEQHN